MDLSRGYVHFWPEEKWYSPGHNHISEGQKYPYCMRERSIFCLIHSHCEFPYIGKNWPLYAQCSLSCKVITSQSRETAGQYGYLLTCQYWHATWFYPMTSGDSQGHLITIFIFITFILIDLIRCIHNMSSLKKIGDRPDKIRGGHFHGCTPYWQCIIHYQQY
jgi:hypothetical protein